MVRRILITGAGSGVGKACAERFLATGWHVGLMGRREASLQAAAGRYENAVVLPCDVSDPVQVETAFAGFGHVDVLFNNAGVFTPAAPIDEIPLADWQKNIDVNLTGSFLCARAAFGAMRRQEPQGGRIINNGSISAHTPRPGAASYTATKHAITGLTKSIALDGRPFDITCGQIDIGNANTEMVRDLTARALKANPDAVAEPTMDVEQVADAVYHMADLPLGTNILSMTVMATKMAFVGRG